MKTITLFAAAMLFVNVANADVYYVVPGGAGNATGADWDNAADLTTATLALGSVGDEFWVKKGVYQNYISYTDRIVYGGFDGTETSLTQRDWAKNQTVLQGSANATTSLVILQNATIQTVLDGFIIQDNHVETSGQNGGGIQMNERCVTRNCIVRNNSSISTANVGGGIFVCGALVGGVYPVIENCLVINNVAANNGGGIQVSASKACLLVNSTVANNWINKADGTAGSGYGCGVGMPPTIELIAKNSIVYNNKKSDGAGGTLTFSFGANAGANNNTISTILNCAYDAINVGSGTQNGVVFTSKTACIDDLSSVKTPGFTLPTSFAGNSSSPSELAEFDAADYRLLSTSVCIDVGNNAAASGITKDLANSNRIFNSTVDMGAYEYSPNTGIGFIASAAWRCSAANGALTVSGLNKGDAVAVYDLSGRTVGAGRATGSQLKIGGLSKGVYLVKLNGKTQKVICK
ncbi:MAG: T9SS type A sorting domain-containing protein [Prevotella sp.]|jgi:parallel beta-helix repeat protein|nr:T9SS type A sorting domain-containing protein [Prevotella sp.]